MAILDTQIMLAGAEPVRMPLALDLVSRGIEVRLVEQRASGDPADAKCNTASACPLGPCD